LGRRPRNIIKGRYINRIFGTVCDAAVVERTVMFQHPIFTEQLKGSPPQSIQCFFSSRPKWDPTTPSPVDNCVPVPFWFRGRDTLACGGRGEGPNSDDGTDTVVLYVRVNVLCALLLPELHASGEHLDHEGCQGDDPTPAPLGVVVLPEGAKIYFKFSKKYLIYRRKNLKVFW
jgi:hypothetical protein